MSLVSRFSSNGIRVLVIESDEATLNDVVQKLHAYEYYRVTSCTKAGSALDILNYARGAFDLLLTEIQLPDIDGLSLLQHLKRNIDIPVVVMSTERNMELAMACLNLGASFYLAKPIESCALENIWQHAVVTARRQPNKNFATWTNAKDQKELVVGQQSNIYSVTRDLGLIMNEQGKGKRPVTSLPVIRTEGDEDEERHHQVEAGRSRALDTAGRNGEEVVDNNVHRKGNRRRRAKGNTYDVDVHVVSLSEKGTEEGLDSQRVKPKKVRVVWTAELHQVFLDAVDRLGIDKAAPRTILELMNKPELTRANVASHLQKFRQHARRNDEEQESRIGKLSSKLSNKKRRRSVFDSNPDRETESNFQNHMGIMAFRPRVLGPSTVPPTLLHRLASSSSASTSSTIATSYMGFSLMSQQYSQPRHHEQVPRQPYGIGPMSFGNATLTFDHGRSRGSTTSMFDFHRMMGGFSALRSFGAMRDAIGGHPAAFGTALIEGNNAQAAGSTDLQAGLLGNKDKINFNNNNPNKFASFHTGRNALSTPVAGIGMQPPQLTDAATSCDTNYEGLPQPEATGGHTEFGPKYSSISSCADHPFSQDVTADHPSSLPMDYDFLDQLIEHEDFDDLTAFLTSEKSAEVRANAEQIDSFIPTSRPNQPSCNNSSTTMNWRSEVLPSDIGATPTLDNVTHQHAQNGIPSNNDFAVLGFGFDDDVTFEGFRRLLLDQGEDGGGSFAGNHNTNFAIAGADDGQGQDWAPGP